jgi:hypothetical protein
VDSPEKEFQHRREGQFTRPFTVEEANEINVEIPMDLWPWEWWHLPDGRMRFGDQALDSF